MLRLKQSLAGGQSTEPVSATRLAPVSRQGFAGQILAEQFTNEMNELLEKGLAQVASSSPKVQGRFSGAAFFCALRSCQVFFSKIVFL
jgi:hypothetical protein